MRLPPDHARRAKLNDEVHARPPELLRAPARISYVAVLLTPTQREAEMAGLAALALRLGSEPPGPDASHFIS